MGGHSPKQRQTKEIGFDNILQPNDPLDEGILINLQEVDEEAVVNLSSTGKPQEEEEVVEDDEEEDMELMFGKADSNLVARSTLKHYEINTRSASFGMNEEDNQVAETPAFHNKPVLKFVESIEKENGEGNQSIHYED